jgi:uncharacterized OB-fold protein
MIRWVCSKCNEKWIHPVEVCVKCNGKINREIGSKFIIAGFTDITIPSSLHPHAPYSVVILKDEHGNLMPKKTLRKFSGDDIGKEFEFNKGEVVIVKVKGDYQSAVEFGLQLVGVNINRRAKINFSEEKGIYANSQQQLISTIEDVFGEGEELEINISLLRVGGEELKGFTIGNAVLAPEGDEPTHLGMLIIGEGEKVKRVFDKIVTGKGHIDFDVGGDELEANIRCM